MVSKSKLHFIFSPFFDAIKALDSLPPLTYNGQTRPRARPALAGPASHSARPSRAGGRADARLNHQEAEITWPCSASKRGGGGVKGKGAEERG